MSDGSKIYEQLNDMQREAVLYTEGPLLILAGAGSGKTRVITHRIAYLIDEMEVNPWNILAITFTNKAAEEMRSRVDRLVSFGAESIWVSTFHSMCVRILRRYADRLGYDNNFTIYDTDDQKSLMKEVAKRIEIDTKQISEKAILGKISSAKNEMTTPDEFERNAGGDYILRKISAAYSEYQKQLKKNNAMDFDDLLCNTVELLQNNGDILDYYQERFRYIMVDEYQDTNTVQFMLIRLLAGKYKNLCVVGDDDQSIYKFRGANIQNILDFEKSYEGAKVIRLEQNYRSFSNILRAANGVIHNNAGRKEKTLWTEKPDGDKLSVFICNNGYDEAERIINDIRRSLHKEMRQYSDFAVLYRTNAQSRVLEEQCVRANLPYKLVGGVNFYQRREIKDILAYLKTVDDGKDDLSVRRIINVPKRGIGATTIERVQAYAIQNDISFYEALKDARHIDTLKSAAISKLTPFVELIEKLKAQRASMSLTELSNAIIEETKYIAELEADMSDEAEDRIGNIDELLSKIKEYEEREEEATLSGFLEEVALVADIDSLEDSDNRVVLMTLHSAKGLEFPCVYLCGMEEGLFPSSMSINADNAKEEIEEERRLCYVGITRAKEHLTFSYAKQRMIRGETRYNAASRFLREVPAELLDTGNGVGSFSPVSNRGQVSFNASDKMVSAVNSQNFGHGFGGNAFFSKKPYESKQFTVTKAAPPDYEAGDTVSHVKFGIGIVKEIVEGGRDYEVTVDFENAGVKKLFASFAKLKKL